MSDDEDAILAARVLAGSHSAFARLVDRHQQAVRLFLRRIAPSLDEAEDLAQETFLSAWQSLASWRGDASLRSWLCAIAWRKARGARRSLFRRLVRNTGYAERMILERGKDVEPEDRLALKAALEALPLEQRAAVALCLSEEFSHTEAAAILGLPLGTVKSHVSRGRERLRAVLGEP
jgi:RNA polymerase sigma-70 factor (ECF subfamily)